MKAAVLSFQQMVKCLFRDVMLFAVCIAPILMGLFFRFVIPAAEQALTQYFHKTEILGGYYQLIDVFFSLMTPTLFCYVAAMVVLEERDEGTARYLCITPLGRRGYLGSRFGIPCVIGGVVTMSLLLMFHLTQLSRNEILYLGMNGGLQGMMVALCIITFSTNKLEGMAVTKVSSLLAAAVIVPYFVTSKVQYMLVMLPSFWIGKTIKEQNVMYGMVSSLLLIVWNGILYFRYLRQSRN